MKTLSLTIRFEDSVAIPSARQFIEAAIARLPGFRSCEVGLAPEAMPLKNWDSTPSPLLVRMEFLCPKQALLNHKESLAKLVELGGVSPAQAVAINAQVPYRTIPVPDALQALMRASKPACVGHGSVECNKQCANYGASHCTNTAAHPA